LWKEYFRWIRSLICNVHLYISVFVTLVLVLKCTLGFIYTFSYLCYINCTHNYLWFLSVCTSFITISLQCFIFIILWNSIQHHSFVAHTINFIINSCFDLSIIDSSYDHYSMSMIFLDFSQFNFIDTLLIFVPLLIFFLDCWTSQLIFFFIFNSQSDHSNQLCIDHFSTFISLHIIEHYFSFLFLFLALPEVSFWVTWTYVTIIIAFHLHLASVRCPTMCLLLCVDILIHLFSSFIIWQ